MYVTELLTVEPWAYAKWAERAWDGPFGGVNWQSCPCQDLYREVTPTSVTPPPSPVLAQGGTLHASAGDQGHRPPAVRAQARRGPVHH